MDRETLRRQARAALKAEQAEYEAAAARTRRAGSEQGAAAVMLADPTCTVCIAWKDGDAAGPAHGEDGIRRAVRLVELLRERRRPTRIQRIENYLMDRARSGGRVQRVAAVIVLAAAGIVALGVGALAAFAQIAALYLVAGYMGVTSPAGPALVIVAVMWISWQVWRGVRTWWRR